MSFNLVDLVKNQVSHQVLGQISHAVGESADTTKSVVDSAIPALLGGLMDKASSDDGASALLDMVKQQDDSILDNLSGVIASKNKDSLIEGGGSMLGSLFGGDAASGLMGAISGASGASQGATSSIIGMVAPMAMSMVKRFMAGGGEMDKAGLADMLMSQKENIAGAMPDGLMDQLGASGFLSNAGHLFSGGAGAATAAVSGLAGAAGSAVAGASDAVSDAADKVGEFAGSAADGVTGAVGDVAGDTVDSMTGTVGSAVDGAADLAGNAAETVRNTASGAVDTAADVAESGRSWVMKLIPIAILAVLAFLALKFFGGKTETPEVSTTAPAVSSMAQSGDVTEQLKGMFGSAQTALGSITDVDSAKAAIPQLMDFSDKLDGVTEMANTLPDAAKPMFDSVVKGGMGQMMPMIDKAMAIPGVGAVLGGVIDPLKEKLAALGG